MPDFLRRLIRFMHQEHIFQLLMLITVIVLISGFGLTLFEPGMSLINGIWWSIVTLTTVGYGDISPVTTGGRAIAIIIMFFGIGLLGMLSANLASLLITRRIKENKGMCGADVVDHIIVCEWNHRARAVIKELRADPHTSGSPLVLIADIEEKPLDDDNLVFIKGSVSEETLTRANIDKAKSVVVLGDDRLEAGNRDAKVVLATLTIESMNSSVYTVVELVDKANEQYCKRAHADEIIIGSELSSHLIASASIDHGISRIISELLSTRYGNEIFSMKAPPSLHGLDCLQAMITLKKEHDAILLGIQKGRGGEFITNPGAGLTISADDYLVVISRDRSAAQSS